MSDQAIATTRANVFDELQLKFKALDETLWENKAEWPRIETWLSQFKDSPDVENDEQIQMLFLASHFMFFGLKEIRALLRSLYRDLYQYNLVEEIRKTNSNTTDRALIEREFRAALSRTRFLGMGNPSESGSHLLYPFRQENRLGKEYFLGSNEVLSRAWWRPFWPKVKDQTVDRYVFIDDLCGSGTQADQYSKTTIIPLKRAKPTVRISYYTLFATAQGLQDVRSLGRFDDVSAVMELDESFKCFSAGSRIYRNEQAPFDKPKAEKICRTYGQKLFPGNPLGWRDGQLLIGFFHNTPDNTLPIIWYDEPDGEAWTPLFKRFPKHYGWEAS